ncbi:ATP-binding protein [Kitasatospora sp. NPDC059646]|uniref:ATP-binding protein n=1 Tax=Kitasatospora sp. NPDC059646 TaxID=3346893 RepID=UPI0036A9F290
MKLLKKIEGLVGLGGDRAAAPPRYLSVSDGLIVTETHAEAWYVLESSNTDLMTEAARDAELDHASSALARTLAGQECHLKVLWSPLEAEDYRDEMAGGVFSAGEWERWADLRVARLQQMGLPTRTLLLGVRLTDRAGAAQSSSRRTVQDAFGITRSGLPARELARLDALMRRLGRRLEASPWAAKPATVDTLAWMIARETHRTTPLPTATRSSITGAQLVSLTYGRVLPYPDHLRLTDERGDVAAWVSVLTMPNFPAEMVSPGNGEWLRTLSEVNYVPELTEDQLDEVEQFGGIEPGELIVPVSPEASVRFTVHHKRDALKLVEQARILAKEQRVSAAKHSAEDPGLDIEETEAAMGGLIRDMRRDDVTLLEDHPRLIVTSTSSLADLRARVDAVITHYGGLGIDVIVGGEEQRELYLETLPGDRIRVPDLAHQRDVTALAGSWFWGGAKLGDDHGPIIGYLTGTTQAAFRYDATAGSDRGDATTTAFIGRSGRGKSTAMMLAIMDAAFRGAFNLVLDFKGDLAGLVTAAQDFGLNAHLVEINSRFAGVLDLFRLLEREGEKADQAQIEVPAQLSIAAPPHLRARGAETPIQRAVNAVIEQNERPATWQVIEYLRGMDDPLARETGDALHELAQTPLGSPFMGRPSGEAVPLRPEPGVWVVQMPGLSLPAAEVAREDWNPLHRMSVALMHSMLAYGVTTAGRRDLRGLRKAVCVPEVHVLTATREGAAFLSYIARVGRALGCALLLDTQDPESLIKLVGVTEQLATVFGFQLTVREQQDALAELLGLPKDNHTRAFIQSIGLNPDGTIRHGHCIARDHHFHAATVQFDVPSAELLELLDTSPKAANEEPDGDDEFDDDQDADDTGVQMEKVTL